MANELSRLLLAEKKRYLVAQRELGGNALGYREFVEKQYTVEPEKYDGLFLEMLRESLKRAWERPARMRDSEDDLFAVAGMALPEFITRPAVKFNADGDEEDAFEKVDIEFATIADCYAYGTILFRKAAQSTARAETMMKAADEARHRAQGHTGIFVRDVVDAVWSDAA